MACKHVPNLKGQEALLWLGLVSSETCISQRTPTNLLSVPGFIYATFCVGLKSGTKQGILDELAKTMGSATPPGQIVSVLGIYNMCRTFPEDFVCYMHSKVKSKVFRYYPSTIRRYKDLMEAGK